MNLILLGAPGAGKGTQAEIICAKLNIPSISTGNILRAAVKEGTEMGLKAKSFMDAGALVPDEVIIGILKERLAQADCANGFILDGVPRTIAQAEAIETMGIRIDKVLELQVEDSVIVERMSGRRVCEKCGASYHILNKKSKVEGVCDLCGGKTVIRKDDQPATVLDRLKAYHEQTEPLVEFYRTRGKLAEIKFCPSIEETTAEVMKALRHKRDPDQKCKRAGRYAPGKRPERSCPEVRRPSQGPLRHRLRHRLHARICHDTGKSQEEKGVTAMDIAKALLDNGIHPPTMYFPLIVEEALMVEPTETETRETLDHAIEVFRNIYTQAQEHPEQMHELPLHTPVRRLDEVGAARNPRLRYTF